MQKKEKIHTENFEYETLAIVLFGGEMLIDITSVKYFCPVKAL